MHIQAIKAQTRTLYVQNAVDYVQCTHKFSLTRTHTDTQTIPIQFLFIYLFIYFTGYTNLGAAYPGAKNNPIPGREEEGEGGSQADPAVQVSPSQPPPPARSRSPFPRPLSLSPILSPHH